MVRTTIVLTAIGVDKMLKMWKNLLTLLFFNSGVQSFFLFQAMKKPPFSDFLPEGNVDLLVLRREAAFLYDAVKLYAQSLRKQILSGKDIFNGKEIVQNLVNQTYKR